MGELFCGAGGLAYGAINAGISDSDYKIVHQWATDIDLDACSTYIHNICPDRHRSVICQDVKYLDMDSLEPIDALTFGFPCNDFSIIGEHKGIDGNYGALYTYGVKALLKFQPLWFLAENVGGINSANGGAAFEIIKSDLKDAGYDIYPHLYKFEEYGVPQARHRVIIVGIRKDLHMRYKIPSPEPYSNIDVSSKTALEVPPIPDNAYNHEMPKQSQIVTERLSYILPGQNVFTADLPDHLKLKVNGAKISQLYKRLHPDKPAYTVIGNGGGGMSIYHYEYNRSLTNRERARLQTFPDSYRFIGSKGSVKRQIGMAVPCKGIKIIFESILKTFAGEQYESIPCNL